MKKDDESHWWMTFTQAPEWRVLGKCGLCRRKVRRKDVSVISSEGTYVCMKCEPPDEDEEA